MADVNGDLLAFVRDFYAWMHPYSDVNAETTEMVDRAEKLLDKAKAAKTKNVISKGTGEFVALLESVGNPDFQQYSPISEPLVVRGKNLSAIVNACARYIKDWNLGGGNWVTPSVQRGGVTVAWISYNGRVWDSPHESAKEITVLS